MTFRAPPEKHRVRLQGYPLGDATNGFFVVPLKHAQKLYVMVSDGLGWEHVSVSRKDRCPTWNEMNTIKDLCWDEDDVVIQYHPPKKDYVNNHPYCLHMWRPAGKNVPVPDYFLVGVKDPTEEIK